MKLYRGMGRKISDGTYKNLYLEIPRLPRNSDQNVHVISDEWFLEKFKVRARSQTIFCSTCIEQAKEYQDNDGSLLDVTVPDGSLFTLIFSLNVNDFIEIEADIIDVKNNRQITDWLGSRGYQCVNKIEELPEGFEGEVMLHCNEYEVRNI